MAASLGSSSSNGTDTSGGSTDSTDSTDIQDFPMLIAISSALSAAGDAGIILSFAISPEARQVFTVRLIFFLSVADLLGQLPVVGSFPMTRLTAHDGVWCSLQASGNWFSALASWLWTMMYAFAVHRCFANASVFPRRDDQLQPSASGGEPYTKYLALERRFHCICWGLPLLAVSVAAGAGQFGHGYAGGANSTCGFLSPTWPLALESVLWIALLYNIFSFAAALP